MFSDDLEEYVCLLTKTAAAFPIQMSVFSKQFVVYKAHQPSS